MPSPAHAAGPCATPAGGQQREAMLVPLPRCSPHALPARAFARTLTGLCRARGPKRRPPARAKLLVATAPCLWQMRPCNRGPFPSLPLPQRRSGGFGSPGSVGGSHPGATLARCTHPRIPLRPGPAARDPAAERAPPQNAKFGGWPAHHNRVAGQARRGPHEEVPAHLTQR